MEVNKPDKGLFKGIGKLEKDYHINKKNFPMIRNRHQVQLDHSHGNMYESNFNYFYKTKFLSSSATNRFLPQKVKKNSNSSQIVLGSDQNDFKTFVQTNYKKYDQSQPPKPIYHKQEGIGLGNQHSENFFKTHNQDSFSMGRFVSPKQRIEYKNWRGNLQFNPITGQSKNIKNTFGYEDFKYNGDKERKYKANNYTKIPKMGEKYDIISGRKLTFL